MTIKDVVIKSFIQGYDLGHSDTVEHGYCDPKERAEDFFEDTKEEWESVNVQNIVTMDEIREIRDSCDKILPKRKPLPDGTLPMTDDELREFNLFYSAVNRLSVVGNFIIMNDNRDYVVDNYKAILYLANLFDLEV